MRYILIIAISFTIACSSSVELPYLDEEQFAQDPNGCRSMRIELIEDLEKDKELLKGLNQNEIVNILGKPDQNELYKRSQKFFIYNLTPTDCVLINDVTPRKYLSIRFNATGLAKEVIIYKD